ncbi:hypothetical protein COT44_03235 [Candidatus Shapirobacteria bacterium CG08_land_8_20_14_0_20_39_18]|uniref:Uncharacterized protein n=1 Tax=Candidatus Shapirobacteria bacterium CG08_land_8_20_14_0_20_39_18 TaxID=1974883 RepID=A0A2M6XCN2_9BACT|nr:MAG: hypothetical protein COT44_03235 [Candidatus Shapirobacteria bacterium CG08_land_8_20_14_0_20_39_18]PIY65073.1 MAG: hypothetical protein COY91_03345 [Candidatus Shapirobacteria bacterium CG_4_10_14_0_8_um_filter_39_15]
MEADQAELFIEITSFFNKAKIPYMITGAWSAIFYGRPRASHDIDFVVELYNQDTWRVLEALKELPEDFSVQEEDIREAIKIKSVFNIIHLPTLLKIDIWLLKDEEFDRSRFKRRKQVKILGQLMWMVSAEDTILQKLRWYQMGKIEKHLVDAAFVYQIQQKNLDKKYLVSWAEKLKVLDLLKEIKKIKPEDYY